MLIAYGPEVEHVGVNPEGVAFSFVVIPMWTVEDLGSRYDQPVSPPAPGQVLELPPDSQSHALGATLRAVRDSTLRNGAASAGDLDEIRRASASVLAGGDNTAGDQLSRPPGHVDDREVVRACFELAESLGRIPTFDDIHSAVFVSERRLRYAFEHTLGRPPSVALRAWALDRARRKLLAADHEVDSVTRIATQLGFAHHGRFSGWYRATFGEIPSQTLTRAS